MLDEGDDAWRTEGGVVTHHTHPLACALCRETAASTDESKDDGVGVDVFGEAVIEWMEAAAGVWRSQEVRPESQAERSLAQPS